MWEPVVERVPPSAPGGKSKRWDMNVTVECHAPSYLGSGVLSPNYDEADAFEALNNLPPLMNVSVQSLDFLQITVTKAFINVLQTLSESFIQDFNQEGKKKKKILPVAPFLVKVLPLI